MIISIYDHYPIYEPAEGGYYYEGRQLIESRYVPFFRVKKALKSIEIQWSLDAAPGEKVTRFKDGVVLSTKYIGDGKSAYVETRRTRGCNAAGWVPYE